MAMDKKVRSIFRLMELLVERKRIRAYDTEIANEMGYSTKTLSRHLKDHSASLSSSIIEVKEGKNKIYELVDISFIFEKIMTNTTIL